MNRLLPIVLFLLLGLFSRAEHVLVRLFSNSSIDLINISVDLGQYDLFGAGYNPLEHGIGEGRAIVFEPQGKKVRATIDGYEYGVQDTLWLMATDTACILCLNPRNAKQRTYEGDLIVTVGKNGKLLIVNDVEFETYIAGVVQSEIYGNQTEIFRVQAIISRTWALRNIDKHRAEGYNFCDQVHCQAYLNRCVRPEIMLGVVRSSGETIVDADEHLIDTPFHSNSGGETANSEDVWRTAKPYLRSVSDTFSYHMRQSEWVKVVDESKWLDYFEKKHHLDIHNDTVRDSLLTFVQRSRGVRICGVPLTRVRSDFKLKSTFFSVIHDSTRHQVTLSGHGYGHGVGLSQEGTIRMVGLGFNYDSIIRHYYLGAHVHRDETNSSSYLERYARQIAQIIEEDKHHQGQRKSKADDWLGRLFRLRDREEREEVYQPDAGELEGEWQYDW